MSRLDPTWIQTQLKTLHARPQKSYGQHFLIDAAVLDDILVAAALAPGERVVEVGPGLGVLTERLVQASAEVTAFEADPILATHLRTAFPALNLVEGDALQTLPQHLPVSPYAVVANIPYQITTPLMRLFLEGGMPQPTAITWLVQYELGKRLAAAPQTSGRGYLSVLCQYLAEVRLVRAVPPSAFWPEPAVASAVVHLKVRPTRALPQEEEAAFLRYVKQAFLEPRKQLKNVLAGIRGVPVAEIAQSFETLGLPITIRCQQLTQEQWIALYRHHV
jgi:16S rRNA (adenine1518-N6/adenine1519-N6)-dimethyltransferase